MLEFATIEQTGGGEYQITGLLNLKSINSLWEAMGRIIEGESEQIQIDISGGIFAGIASLALLISLTRVARDLGKNLVFTKPPSSLLNLVQANGMMQMLAFDTDLMPDES